VKKEFYDREVAEELLHLLHEEAIPYELQYESSYHQLDGHLRKWTFTVDPSLLMDAMLNTKGA
jgi:hypothetical protein